MYINVMLEHWQFLAICLAIIVIAVYLLVKHYIIQKAYSLSKYYLKNQSLKLFIQYWIEPILLIILTTVINFLLPNTIKEQPNYIHLLEIVKISIFTLFEVRIIGTIKDIITYRNKKYLQNLSVRRINTQINILAKIAIVILIIIGSSLIIMTFPFLKKIGVSILTSAGIIGIALGFAAQRSLSNIWAGIQIAMMQPIKIGDKVVVENEVGTIEAINLTYVVMHTIGNRKLIIPINYFNEKIFHNWTRNSLDLLAVISIGVSYAIPIYQIEQELDQILNQTPLWDKKIKTFQVMNIKHNAIELRITASATQPSDAQELQYYIRRRLIDFLQGNVNSN